MSRRLERINGLLRQELSEISARELRDPRLPVLFTITRVEVASDLRHAKVFVSILGDSEEQLKAMEALQSAAGFLQRELRPRLQLRYVPILLFHLDHSLEEGHEMLRAIENISSNKELM